MKRLVIIHFLKGIMVLLSCMLYINPAKAQDMIYKKDNSTIKARVLEVNAASVVYKPFDQPGSAPLTIGKNEIAVIVYQNGLHEVFNQAPVAPDTIYRVVRPQPRSFKNLVFAELGGNGGFYSLNYERRFRLGDQLSTAARIGYSGLPAGSGYGGISISEYRDCQTIPVSVSLLFGKTHLLELGAGYTPLIITEKSLLYDYRNYAAPSIGYRYQNWSRRFCFRAGLVLGLEVDKYPIYPFIPLPYFSWGFAF